MQVLQTGPIEGRERLTNNGGHCVGGVWDLDVIVDLDGCKDRQNKQTTASATLDCLCVRCRHAVRMDPWRYGGVGESESVATKEGYPIGFGGRTFSWQTRRDETRRDAT